MEKKKRYYVMVEGFKQKFEVFPRYVDVFNEDEINKYLVYHYKNYSQSMKIQVMFRRYLIVEK
jgi:hypothetical protein